MATSVVNPRVQFFANNGRPLIGGRIHTYVAGSSTRARTYKDAAKAQPNTNPIVLDGRGEAQIYLAEGVEYKFVVEDSKGTLIYTQEPVYGAIWPNAADWPSDATLAYKYAMQSEAARDEAYAAVESIGVVHFFDKYADYAGGISAGEIVEIANDETRNNFRTRYKIQIDGSLQYLVTLPSQSSIRHAILSYPDYAAASAAAATLPDGQVVLCPDANGRLSDYVVDAGALEFKDFVPDAVRMQSYSALRAYTGKAGAIEFTARRVASLYVVDPDDTATPDDGGYCVVDARGRRFKRVLKDNKVHVGFWGAAGNDWNADADTDTAAFLKATAFAKANGCTLDISGGQWVLDDTWVWPEFLTIEGSGAGQWLAWTPVLPKKKAPSQVRFIGTGQRKWAIPLVTDMRTSGGVLSNPSSRDANDTYYRLTSFTNEDGTPRLFSCAVKTDRSGRGIVARNFRIVLDHNGIEGYNDAGNLGLGADWDVGFWNESGQNLILDNVHVVGYWRMYGELETAVIDNDDAVSGSSRTGAEYSRYLRCNFQGAVGVGIRGGDQYRITEVGADYVGIENASNLPFKAAPTGRIRVGSSTTSSAIYSYTAVTVVGANLRLTIGSTSGISVGHIVTSNVHGFGVSNTVYEDCEITGLGHASQRRATALGFTKPSACIEISGTFIRGISFRGSKPLGVDDVLLHAHDATDIDFDGQAVFETKPAQDAAAIGTSGGRVICSPSPSNNTRVSNPAGSTDRVRIDYGSSITNAAVDMRPFTSLSAPSRFNGAGDLGFFQPQSIRWMDRQYPMDRSNTVTRAPNGGYVLLQDSAGSSLVRAGSDGASLRSSANAAMVTANYAGTQVLLANTTASVGLVGASFRGLVDGAASLGSSAVRYQDLYLVNAPTVTSDQNLKTELSEIDDAVFDAWGDVRIGVFQWLDAIAAKGEAARRHVGVIAQQVVAAFAARGLDATRFGIVCFEAYNATDEIVDVIPAVFDEATGELISAEQTQVVVPARESGEIWTMRATECLYLEAAYQRRERSRDREEFAQFKQEVLQRLSQLGG